MTPPVAASPPPARPRALRFGHWLALLLLANVFARLPLCPDPTTVSPDGAEYLAIARSLRATGQYATDLKWQFYTDDPVRHAAWADRPPLYPVVAAACSAALPFLSPTTAARLGNVLLTCLALLLGALYLRRLYGERVALLAAGYVFLLPHTLFWTSQPLTEAISLALGLGALLAWSTFRAAEHRGTPLALATGLLIGLAYLTRPTGLLLLPVLALDALRLRRERPHGPGALLAGFLLCAVPYHLLLARLYGSPFHSALGYTFAIGTVHEVTLLGLERSHPSALEFLRTRGAEVPALVWAQALRHAEGILLPLLGLLPFAVWMRRSDWRGERWIPGALVALMILIHTATWSARGSSRYFLLALLLLAAALLAVGERLRESDGGARWLALLLPVATGAGLILSLAGFYRTQLGPRAAGSVPSLAHAAAGEARGTRLVASDEPWIVNLLAETPAVMLPRTTDPAQLERFVTEYRPDVLILFVDAPEEAAQAAAWRSGGLPAGWTLDDRGPLLVAKRAPAAAGRPHPKRR